MTTIINIFKIRKVRIIFGLVYILAAAEIFLRIFNPVPMLPRYVEPKYYGIRGNIGSKQYWHITPEVKVQIRTNSAGIRADYEIPYQKAKGVKRIVVLGDSFGMGYEVNLEDTFLEKMNEILNKSGIKCEVVNLSSSGHSNAEELIVLQNEGFKYNPDLVLLAWHASDLNENIRSNLFKLESGKLKRKAATYLPGAKIQEFLFRHPVFRFLTDDSQLFNWARDNAGRKTKSLIDFCRLYAQKNKNNNTENTNRHDTITADYTIALLKEIKNQCDKRNIKFLVFDIPSRKSRTEFKSVFPANKDGIQYHFNYVSPLNAFNQHKGELLYWERGHGHFTPKACSLSGQSIAEYIINNNLLE